MAEAETSEFKCCSVMLRFLSMVQPINVQFPTDTIFWSISTQLNTSEEAVDIPSGFVLFPLSFSNYNCLNNCLAIC